MGMAEKAINRKLRSRLFRRDSAFKTLSSFRRTEEISVFDIEMNFSKFLLPPPPLLLPPNYPPVVLYHLPLTHTVGSRPLNGREFLSMKVITMKWVPFSESKIHRQV